MRRNIVESKEIRGSFRFNEAFVSVTASIQLTETMKVVSTHRAFVDNADNSVNIISECVREITEAAEVFSK